jgi:hypothetical protein
VKVCDSEKTILSVTDANKGKIKNNPKKTKKEYALIRNIHLAPVCKCSIKKL